MNLSSDFRDLLHAFSAARVRFLVVGGYAVIHHTEPRFTKDLDVWIHPTAANAARVMKALRAFGAPIDSLSSKDFEEPNIIYQIGVAPVRVDILTSIKGLDFDAAFRRSVVTEYAGVPTRVLSLLDILAAKRAAGRPQDLLDAEKLDRALAQRAGSNVAERSKTNSLGAEPPHPKDRTTTNRSRRKKA